ncbi:hypothetical protein D3C85_1010530 [compost metagenome]
MVVTTITPFIALAPYIPVAAASFRILKLSISSGFKPATEDPINVLASPVVKASFEMLTTSSRIIPSTTQSGLLSPENEVAPRTRILGAAPKVPETFCIVTPATWPSSIRLTSVTPALSASAALINVEAPVKVFFSRVW